MKKSDTTEDAAERDFVLTRVFDVPRSLVFKAWTDPKHMAQWWGPRIATTPICEMDVRPGGAYRIVMRLPDGNLLPLKGFYREVVEPERLVWTMDHSELPPEWHDKVDPNRQHADAVGEATSTITFEDLDGKTKLTIRIRFVSTDIRNAMMRLGMNEGWTESLARLAELAAKM